jgi:hypothetical protein
MKDFIHNPSTAAEVFSNCELRFGQYSKAIFMPLGLEELGLIDRMSDATPVELRVTDGAFGKLDKNFGRLGVESFLGRSGILINSEPVVASKRHESIE